MAVQDLRFHYGKAGTPLLARIEAEALLITVAGALAAAGLLTLSTTLAGDVLAQRFGLFLDSSLNSHQSTSYILAIIASALAVGLIPGVAYYRKALHQQLA